MNAVEDGRADMSLVFQTELKSLELGELGNGREDDISALRAFVDHIRTEKVRL